MQNIWESIFLRLGCCNRKLLKEQ